MLSLKGLNRFLKKMQELTKGTEAKWAASSRETTARPISDLSSTAPLPSAHNAVCKPGAS